jgi:hypothetical protein
MPQGIVAPALRACTFRRSPATPASGSAAPGALVQDWGSTARESLELLRLMAITRAHSGTILKGGRLKTPDVKAQQAALPQDKKEESSASEQKSNKASQSAPTTKPKAAA